MIKKTLLGFALIAASATLALADVSQPSPQPPMQGHMKQGHCNFEACAQMREKELAQKLSLSSEQISKLEVLQKALKEKMKALRPTENPLAKYGSSGTFDKDSFTADATTKSNERIKVMGEFFSSFVAILTPEQKLKLKDLQLAPKAK